MSADGFVLLNDDAHPLSLSLSLDSFLSAEERLIAEGLDGEKDPGGESFENLFARFAQMKRKH